jgi:hypothetical protein
MPGIQFTQAPLLDPTAKTALSIGGQIDAIGADRTPTGRYVSEALRSLKNWAHFIEAQLTNEMDNRFPEILVLGEGGQLIGWIGARDGYNGGYFSQLYVGGSDPSNAPFFTDVNGNLTIGQNGSVTIRDASATRVGFLGVETEATKAVISISNATPPVVNVVAHGYVTGDSVTIAGDSVAAYNANWPINVIDANNFSLTGGVASGVGAGGTAARYYAGAWLKTEAVGGTGFADAKFRVFGDGSLRIGAPAGGRIEVDAAGNVTITGAAITATAGANSIALDPATASLVLTGSVAQTNIFQGLVEVTKVGGVNPYLGISSNGTVAQLINRNAGGVVVNTINSGTGFDTTIGYKVNGATIANGAGNLSSANGTFGTITIPKLTPGGVNGSISVSAGIVTAFTNPT